MSHGSVLFFCAPSPFFFFLFHTKASQLLFTFAPLWFRVGSAGFRSDLVLLSVTSHFQASLN